MAIERASQWSFGLAAAAVSPMVYAHTLDTSGAGFASGFAHPFLGLDHLVAVLAVGQAASIGLYGFGLVFATIVLHAAGFLLGDRLGRRSRGVWLRASGGAVTAAGALARIAG